MNRNEKDAVLAAEQLEKRFGSSLALDRVSLAIPRGRVVGLVGRNGSGKTTLLRTFLGLLLPTSGSARAFGTQVRDLGDDELARIGAVQQENRFLSWMSGRAHLSFVKSFYERWDDAREKKLVEALELDVSERIGAMSPGNVQKLAIVTATCHRPEVLLLDEPAAALDPIAREALLRSLLDVLREDEPAIVISSHALRDVERTVDWIVCLEKGRVVEDAALDALQERYAQWRVTTRNGTLPNRFDEPFVLSRAGDERQALLCVRDASAYEAAFKARHHVDIETRPLGLEAMFPLWIARRTP